MKYKLVRNIGHIVTGDELRAQLIEEGFRLLPVSPINAGEKPMRPIGPLDIHNPDSQEEWKRYALGLKAYGLRLSAEKARYKLELFNLTTQLSHRFLIASANGNSNPAVPIAPDVPLFFQQPPNYSNSRFALTLQQITTYPLDWICYKFHDQV